MQYLLDTSICVFYLRGKLNLLISYKKKAVKIFLFQKLLSPNFATVPKIATILQRYTKR